MYFTHESFPLFTRRKGWLFCSDLTTTFTESAAIETDPRASILLIYEKNRKNHKHFNTMVFYRDSYSKLQYYIKE